MARLRSNRGRRILGFNPVALAAAATLGVGTAALAGVYLLADDSEAEVAPAAEPRPDVALASLAQKPIITATPSVLDEPAPATRPATVETVPAVAPAPPPVAAPSAQFLNEAKAHQDAGRLLDARRVLNDALQTGRLDPATSDEVKSRIRDLNQTIVFTPTKRFADDPQQSTYTVQSGDLLTKICRDLDVPYGFVARVNAVRPDRIRVGQSLKLIQGPIHAVVSKSRYTMDLYLGALPGRPGSMYLTTYRVGLGERSGTPTGVWEVSRDSKTVNPAWTNPRTNEVYGRDDPQNPLGERWVGLTGIAGDAVGAASYGIHGTIEPDTIGTDASMGCIRLKNEDVEEVFDMLSESKSTVMVVE